ncbi:Hpt domain-containing protein [Oleidesulfovibrio sp.]|uniref:Hpt domain-containing protein n=1 Tax=Oleidesulfovibrio sp. TaxID=2909707 RepID=UPI003A89F87F
MPELHPILDLDDTLLRLGGDVELLHTLYDAYLEDTPKKMRQLALAIEQDDFIEVRHIAHTLKGSSATVGASSMSNIAQALENDCIEGKLTDVRSRFIALTKVFAEATEAINKQRHNFSSCN